MILCGKRRTDRVEMLIVGILIEKKRSEIENDDETRQWRYTSSTFYIFSPPTELSSLACSLSCRSCLSFPLFY